MKKMTYSRRAVVAASASLGALAAGTGRGIAQTPVASPAASPVTRDGAWSFIDDRGVTSSLPEVPMKIIAQTSSAAALWDFGIEPVGFFGPVDPDNPTGFAQVGSIDLAKSENLGDYGDLDLEKVVALGAQLYVDLDRGGGTLWYLDADAQKKLEAICATVGLKAYEVSVLDIVKRYGDLAFSLGVDPATPDLVAATATHATAEAAFKDAVAAADGLKVVAISGGPDAGSVYIWNGEMIPDLIYFRDLGMDYIDINAEAGASNLQIALEQIGEYPADLILFDFRDDISVLSGNPVWESLPAVKAGQVGLWYGAFPYSYQELSRVLDLMTAQVAKAKVIL
ncbi:MAG TPA: ABC transporter substrate-binding protein [Thermomicrobiales bacterium]|nr:ABC transporter substrate-binding protein [Thermomicrobiales bacterium]